MFLNSINKLMINEVLTFCTANTRYVFQLDKEVAATVREELGDVIVEA